MQERQFPDSTSERHRSSRRAPRLGERSRRLQGFAALSGALVLALLATGCPEAADLANPNSYACPNGAPPDASGNCASSGAAGSGGGSGGGGGGTGGGGSTDACLVACVNTILNADVGCKLCHSTDLALGALDLQSAGVTSRLKDVAAKHQGIAPPPTPGDCPTGAKLIDSANPSASWLLAKIKGTQKTCGGKMPAQGLSDAELMCMETYVNCVANQASAAASTSASGGSGGTAGSGTGGT